VVVVVVPVEAVRVEVPPVAAHRPRAPARRVEPLAEPAALPAASPPPEPPPPEPRMGRAPEPREAQPQAREPAWPVDLASQAQREAS
jgi:hypothetical protein